VRKIALYPGDTASTFHNVQSTANEAKSGISTHYITPIKVGIYSNKIQCSCSEEQRPKAGETTEMPVPSHTDPDFEKDPKMKDVDSITLAYVSVETPAASPQRELA
jgi:cytochrome c oxidase assembly protein subunit 11